jgi:hypothetical protein
MDASAAKREARRLDDLNKRATLVVHS